MNPIIHDIADLTADPFAPANGEALSRYCDVLDRMVPSMHDCLKVVMRAVSRRAGIELVSADWYYTVEFDEDTVRGRLSTRVEHGEKDEWLQLTFAVSPGWVEVLLGTPDQAQEVFADELSDEPNTNIDIDVRELLTGVDGALDEYFPEERASEPPKTFKRRPAADPVTILGLGSSDGPLIVSRPGSPPKKVYLKKA